MDSKVRQLEMEKEHAIAVSKAATEDYQNLGTRYKELEIQLDAVMKDSHAQVEDYKRKLEEATSRLQHLAARTEELKGAQTFSSTDRFSSADLIKDLERLNEEILHLTASMVPELVAESLAARRTDSKPMGEAARKFLGRRLVALLTTSLGLDAKIVLHLAFQTVLGTCAQWIIAAASCSEGLESDAFNKIYESIRGTGKFQSLCSWCLQCK